MTVHPQAQEIVMEARVAYADVPFPVHRGIRAAMAIDEWTTEASELARITAASDFHGDWWDVPFEELRACSLGIVYLDAVGTAFYLPAYLTMALTTSESTDHQLVLWFLDAGLDAEEQAFAERLSSLSAPQKNVCRRYLNYLESHLSVDNAFLTPEQVARSANHPIWKTAP